MNARMRVSLLMLGLGLLVTEPTAAQRLYSWRDAQGVMHYSSHPPAQPPKQVDELTIDGQGQLSALSERERLYARQAAVPLDGDDSQRQETCAAGPIRGQPLLPALRFHLFSPRVGVSRSCEAKKGLGCASCSSSSGGEGSIFSQADISSLRLSS